MITCNIFTINESQFLENVKSITLDWENQEVELLPGHAQFYVAVEVGRLTLEINNSKKTFDLTNAFINFENSTNTLSVFQ